jgi:hypothetical protein
MSLMSYFNFQALKARLILILMVFGLVPAGTMYIIFLSNIPKLKEETREAMAAHAHDLMTGIERNIAEHGGKTSFSAPIMFWPIRTIGEIRTPLIQLLK